MRLRRRICSAFRGAVHPLLTPTERARCRSSPENSSNDLDDKDILPYLVNIVNWRRQDMLSAAILFRGSPQARRAHAAMAFPNEKLSLATLKGAPD